MDSITDSMDMSLSKLWQMVKDREVWAAAVRGGRKESNTIERMNNNKNSGPTTELSSPILKILLV